MILIAKATIQIQKPIDVVFDGIVNPDKMTRYFISESSGKMETGKELTWKFPEFDEKVHVRDVAVVTNTSVSFVWDDETTVKILLEEQADKSTLVKVTEDGKAFSEDNLKWVVGNTEGWANFLACLKAFLEYGIELRKGAFDFMKSNCS